jgi:DNA helicase-2/ATP-dependent DNA helicase PcrA
MLTARLIGGAGTGKTTELLRIMDAALESLHDPLRLGFASFTRAARGEAVARAAARWNVDERLLSEQGWFRTIHSTVYRCLQIGHGEIIGNSKADTAWLSEALGVQLATVIAEDTGAESYLGDPVAQASLDCWSLARASLTPLTEIARRAKSVDDNVPDYAAIVRLCERYETRKRLDGRMDFADLLCRFAGVTMTPDTDVRRREPEGELPDVSAWLFDEQQDASPLLDAVCQRLVSAPSVQWCYVVGDPFQSIYGYAGSNSKCFLGWEANKQRTMPKSYRCPAPILELGERCLRRMHTGYFDRGIAPADHEGSVTEIGGIEAGVARVDPRADWLLIARTKYQTKRLAAEMHAQGKPMRWASADTGITNRGIGLLALYSLSQGNAVTGHQWAKALELLPVKDRHKQAILVRGAKTRWRNPDEAKHWDQIYPNELTAMGATEALAAAIASGEWVSLVDGGAQWKRMADKWGAELASEPRVRVGTIHSVKGAEADHVLLLTTTSNIVAAGEEDAVQHDEECRIAYVAVTRTRRNLYVVNEGKPGTKRMEIL